MFLVQGMQDLGIGENLIEALAGIGPRIVRQADRELADGAEFLYLPAVLVQPRLAGNRLPGTAVAVAGPAGRRPRRAR
jgi:hypothetical protein